MTNDPVDEVVLAYLDHLEDDAPEPSLDHLSPDDRALAQDLINSLIAGRGIDPYQSRPPVHALLAGTEFEYLLTPAVNAGLTIDSIRTDVVSALGAASEPIADGAAQNEGIRSDAVVRFGSLRIRIQFRDDITNSAGLAEADPRTAAGPVFGCFSETAAVVLVIGDQELSSAAVGPFDTDEFISTPGGEIHRPQITRPVLSLYDTLRGLADELAPDLTGDDAREAHETVDLDDIIRAECLTACADLAAEGKRARTNAKEETWAGFDEVALLAKLVEDAMSGDLSEAEVDARLTPAEAA
jgi:hypothetical protein